MSITNEDYFAMMVDFASTVQSSQGNFSAIFDNSHKEYMDAQTGETYSTVYPMLVCRTVDVTTIEQETELVVNSTDYVVRDIQPDGWGITTLILKRK